MGRNKELKKQRKYARQEVEKSFRKFQEEFSVSDYVKPCPKLIPSFVWNVLVWIVIKHK